MGCSSSDSSAFIEGYTGLSGQNIPAVMAAGYGTIYAPTVFGTYFNSQGGTSSYAINMFNGMIQVTTITGNILASTVSNLTAGEIIIIGWQQGSGGGYTYVWPSICKFNGGAAPTPSTTAGSVDTVTFYCDGTYLWEMSRSIGMH